MCIGLEKNDDLEELHVLCMGWKLLIFGIE